MQVLVAAERARRRRPADRVDTIDGELVVLAAPDDPDVGIEALRVDIPGFVGVESRGLTATAVIVELRVAVGDLVGLLVEVLGADAARATLADRMAVRVAAHRWVTEMVVVAGHFPIGTIVERRGVAVCARTEGQGG